MSRKVPAVAKPTFAASSQTTEYFDEDDDFFLNDVPKVAAEIELRASLGSNKSSSNVQQLEEFEFNANDFIESQIKFGK